MDKSNLKLKTHKVLPGREVVEVWYLGELVATVYGADGPGVRVVSKHPISVIDYGTVVNVNTIDVMIEPRGL